MSKEPDGGDSDIGLAQSLEKSYAAEDALIAANHAKEDEELKCCHANQLPPAAKFTKSFSAHGSEVCDFCEQVFYTHTICIF